MKNLDTIYAGQQRTNRRADLSIGTTNEDRRWWAERMADTRSREERRSAAHARGEKCESAPPAHCVRCEGL
jgi:hypothetical protein